MAESLRGDVYTLELAEQHIANLNGNVARIGESFTQDDADHVPNTPATGNIQYSASGQQKYVSSSDGNAYNTGNLVFPATPSGSYPYSVTTAFTTIPGLSAPLGVGAYVAVAQVLCSVPVTAGQGQISYQVTASGGLVAASGRMGIVETHAANGVGASDFVALGTPLGGVTPGTGGANHVVRMQGYFVVTVAGTLNIQIKQAATAAITIPQYGTYLQIFPAVSS